MVRAISKAREADDRHEIEETVQTVLYPSTEVVADSRATFALLKN